MSSHLAVSPLVFSPQASADVTGAGRLPASADAARRFEQLFFAPQGSAGGTQAPALTEAIGNASLRNYIERLSHRWQAGQSSLQHMMEAGQFTSKELVLTQIQMINCALDVEVSSKCASMLESGVQTLIQRGS